MSQPLRQEIFNRVYKGLESQGFLRSVLGESGSCAYRGDNGLKCAIGHLISDDEYRPEFEGYGVGYIAESLRANILYNVDTHFTMALQTIHDRSLHPDEMREQLTIFALEFGLTIPDTNQRT